MITPNRPPTPTPQEKAAAALAVISNSVQRLPALLNRLTGAIDRLAHVAQLPKDRP
jgi:hypothetical protein